MIFRALLITLSVAILTGCAKEKYSFWKNWSASDGSEVIILNGGKFDEPFDMLVFRITQGAACSCSFWADGTEHRGTYAISNCGQISGPPSNACNIGQAGSYSAPSTILSLCKNADPDDCTVYQ